jgi:hypothetical protein
MMTRTIVLLVLVSVLAPSVGRAAPGDGSAPRPIRPACKLDALTSTERKESLELRRALLAAVSETKELPDGFAVRIDTGRLPFSGLSRWVDLERRCCPFFHFQVDVAPDHGPLWLRLTGAEGVKELIKASLAS